MTPTPNIFDNIFDNFLGASYRDYVNEAAAGFSHLHDTPVVCTTSGCGNFARGLYKRVAPEEDSGLCEECAQKKMRSETPFDLDRLVAKALALVQETIDHSRHQYTLLEADDPLRAAGFVTREGALGHSRLHLTNSTCFRLDVSAAGSLSYVRNSDFCSKQLIDSMCVLFGFLVMRNALPKALKRFAKELPT